MNRSVAIGLAVVLSVGGLAWLVGTPRSAPPDVPHVVPAEVASPPTPLQLDGPDARRSSDALVAGRLLTPWSQVRSAVAPQADEALLGALNDATTTLAIARRNPSQAPPLTEIVAELDGLARQIEANPEWAKDPRVGAALSAYRNLRPNG